MNSIKTLILVFCCIIPLHSLYANLSKNCLEKLYVETSFKRIPFEVHTARTSAMLKKGLMFRQSIAENEGMLFIFARPHRARFWMQNTYISLDLLFLDKSGRVVGIIQKTEPLSTKPLESAVDVVQAVLEVKGGTVEQYNIGVGDRIRHVFFETPCPQPKVPYHSKGTCP